VFVVLVGALVIGLSIVLGFVAFVILGSVIAVLAAIIGIRIWWLNRKVLRRAGRQHATGSETSDRVIEGEFRVVDDSRRGEDRDGR